MKHSAYHTASNLSRVLAPWLLTLALTLLPAAGLRAGASASALRLTNTGKNTEALPTFRLDWDATSNSTYLVQSATSLARGATWSTLDAVFPTDKAGSYQLQVTATDSTGQARPPATFYRLILPQPQIFSVEPAIVAPGSTNDFYVLGQCFPTNAELRIKNLPQSGTIYQSSSTLVQPSFTPDVAGDYQVSLVVSGQVVSSFTVVCADLLVSPELVLQGPPTEPPASPSALWLSKRGYDYWKARSDMASASPETEALSDSYVNRKISKMAISAPPDSGKGINQPGLKRGIDPVSATFETQEGKKGLNAVNVKLARAAGSEGFYQCGSDDYSLLMPALMKAKEKANQCKSMAGVDPFSGEVQACAVDLAIPGRELDFVWARTYHSRLGRTGASANGWTFSYDVSCAQNSSGGIDVYDGTGRKDTFKLGTNGVYTCPELFREGALSNTTFTLTFADTGRWVFNPFDNSPTAGLVHQVITRNGSVITLSHNAASGRLEQVVDDLDRTNTITCDTSGRVTSVTDFSGRTVRYEYDSNGDLVACVSPPVLGTPNGDDFPGGKTNRYTYSSGYPLAQARQNHLLLSCADALEQTTAQFTYDLVAASASYLRCTAVQEGANPATCFSFTGTPHVPVLPASLKCTVNDPVGNVTECFFDARGRCVVEREFTGRATPGTPVTDNQNRPTSKVRQTDPDYYETQCTWNNDSLCTSETSPGGQQVRCVYQSDFDPATPARKRADCRVVSERAPAPVDLNGDGALDTSERVWSYQYDPRFGSDPTASYGKKLYVGNLPFSIRESPTEPSRGMLRESPSKQSLGVAVGGGSDAGALGKEKKRPGRESPTLASLGKLFLRESPTLSHLRESPTLARLRESPTKASLLVRESPTLASLGQTALRESPSKASLGKLSLRESPTLASLRESPSKASLGYCTSETDPRGNVTESSYDVSGNVIDHRIKYKPGTVIHSSCAYDSHGQLTAITKAPDANGRSRVDTFAWSQGQMTQCVIDGGPDGLALTSAFEYDERGNLTRCIDPRTNDWLFAYNSLDQLVQSSSATLSLCFCKIEWKYEYDANDNLVRRSSEVLDPAGKSQGICADNYRYDSLQRLTECALAVDDSHVITNRFVYDANGQCVRALGPDAVSGANPLQFTRYLYDERQLLFCILQPTGENCTNRTDFEVDVNMNLTRVTGTGNECGINTKLDEMDCSYDAFGRPATITDAMGNQTVCFFDANDNLKVVRLYGETNDVPGSAGNVRLAESRFEYDSLDQCAVVHDLHFNPATQSSVGDGEATTRLVFAPNGDCTSVTDDLGLVTSFDPDTAGRLYKIRKITSSGVIAGIVVARDTCGNITSVMETNTSTSGGPAQVFACTYVYDSLSRLVSCTDSAGNTDSCAYDSLGHVVRVTDALGNDTTCAYDFMGDCLACVSYAGSSSLQPATVLRSSSATYDSNLRCASSTDANGNTTSYAYDTLGNCTLVIRPDFTHEQFVWSPRSNLQSATDPNGNVSVCTYDLNDRLVRRDITTGGGAGGSAYFEAFSYDACDRLTAHHDDDCDGAFAYDSLGSCVRETLNGLATVSTCDALGNRRSLTYPGGRVLTCAYDAASRCTNITESGATLASFAYTGSRLSEETCGNGVRSFFDYDGLVGTANDPEDHGFGQVSHVRHTLTADSSVLSECKFSYDLKQNKTMRTVAIPGAGGRTNEMTLDYDALDQLVHSVVMEGTTALRATAYGLDRMGNRTNVTSTAACSGDYMMDGSAFFDFQMNQYTATPCDTRTYDDNGNLVSRSSLATGAVTTYSYDYADRLVAVQSEVDNGTGGKTITPVASYTYDALGRRASKTLNQGTLAASTRQYCYDGTCAIEERVNGAVASSYLLQDCALIGLRQGSQDYFVHTDDQGNALALTGANGAVAERYDYDDYGAVTFLTPDGTPTSDTSSAAGNPYCWGGLRLDAETGLQNDDGGGYLETSSGRSCSSTYSVCYSVNEGNPWSGGGPVEMKNGVVKFFNDAKGFGFIKEDGGQEVAKHYITIPHNLSKVKALGANGEGKKEFVGHVSLLK